MSSASAATRSDTAGMVVPNAKDPSAGVSNTGVSIIKCDLCDRCTNTHGAALATYVSTLSAVLRVGGEIDAYPVAGGLRYGDAGARNLAQAIHAHLSAKARVVAAAAVRSVRHKVYAFSAAGGLFRRTVQLA